MKRVVAVFHGAKVEGLAGIPLQIGANPPMTVDGMVKILALVPALKALGPFTGGMYCSRIARALDTASVIAGELDMDFQTMASLGQQANLDKAQDKVLFYPGRESDTYDLWQQQGLRSIENIAANMQEGQTALMVSHRPIIGGAVAMRKHGICTESALIEFIRDPALSAKGYVVFEIDGPETRVVE